MYRKQKLAGSAAALSLLFILTSFLGCKDDTQLINPLESTQVVLRLQFPQSSTTYKASPQHRPSGTHAITDVAISVINAVTREVMVKEQQLEVSFDSDLEANVARGNLSFSVPTDGQTFRFIAFAADVQNLFFLIGSSDVTLVPGQVRHLDVALRVPQVISQFGTASASSEFDANSSAAAGADFELSTSWFSNGAQDGSTSTFTWSAPGNFFIPVCAIVNNLQHPDPTLQSGFGFESILFQVFDGANAAGNLVYEETVGYPQTAQVPFVKITPLTFGQSIRLTLQNPNNPQRGGFSDLLVAQLESPGDGETTE